MADLADRAQQHVEKEDELLRLQNLKPVMIRPNGYCHNCGTKVEIGLYCDADCRDDYEYRAERGIA